MDKRLSEKSWKLLRQHWFIQNSFLFFFMSVWAAVPYSLHQVSVTFSNLPRVSTGILYVITGNVSIFLCLSRPVPFLENFRTCNCRFRLVMPQNLFAMLMWINAERFFYFYFVCLNFWDELISLRFPSSTEGVRAFCCGDHYAKEKNQVLKILMLK